MMKLSIVIVNYNVKHFLEQCLNAVYKAIENIPAEVFVVDNNSVDGSAFMVKSKFPGVHFIENKVNVGFSKANNQAFELATGEYILALNPDTLVEEASLSKCIRFMDEHIDTGGLGVKMIDGKGNFLPESKRALPTPITSFYKIFGFSRLFPKSKIFGRYHLGHIDNDMVSEVEILCGAFMLMRKKALEITGYFDEAFFMYGEDIDLSYRLLKAGYKNIYFPETTIIHYKGESTKKGSINYVIVFYNAMLIFARKHFSKKNIALFSLSIKFAIYFRASLSIIKRFIGRMFLPFADAALIYSGYIIIKPIWENFKFNREGTYPPMFLYVIVPVYILIWLMSLVFSGAYDKPISLKSAVNGILYGTFAILVLYALLPLDLRFSRALILIGAMWSLVILLLLRLALHFLRVNTFRLSLLQKRTTVIVGEEREASRISDMFKTYPANAELIGIVNPLEDEPNGNDYIGNLSQLTEIVKINKVDEIIFSGKNLSAQEIINNMLQLAEFNVDFKIAPPESMMIIGSSSINTFGDFYLMNLNSIASSKNRRNKRTIDIICALLFLLTSPALIFIFRRKGQFLLNCFKVLIGQRTWVGYHETGAHQYSLPGLKRGYLSSASSIQEKLADTEMLNKINMMYAKDYRVINDLNIIFKGFKKLGQ
jgi:O-antigen biosynthesis protein